LQALTAEQKQELRQLLLSQKDKLQQQLRDAESATEIVTLDQTAVGRISRMDAMQQQSMAVSTRAKAETSLRKVIAALKRVETEDFGRCIDCDAVIEFNRLRIQAEAGYCLSCQSKLDQL
jgi:DnaK suppressor protein